MSIDLDSERKKNEATTPALGQRAFGGAIWMLGQTLGSKVAAIAAQLVLAALLAKDDFGRVAEVVLIVSLAALGQQLGIDAILVRRHRRFEVWAEIAFWINLCAGLIGAAAVITIAPFADHFFKDAHGLRNLLLVAAVGLPFDATAIVSQAKLRIDSRFRALALIGTGNVVGTAILSVMFAASKFIWPQSPLAGAMSLILPRPIISAGVLLTSFFLSGMRLKMRPAFRRWAFVLRDSRYFLFISLFNTLLGQGDYLIAGLFFSAEQLGAYYFAYNLSTQTVQLVCANLTSVLLPSFSKLDREPARQKQAYLKVCSIIAFIGTIACSLQFIMGGPLLHLVYGSKWDESIPMFQLLTVGMICALPTIAGISLLQAQGRYRRLMMWTFISMVCFMVSVLIGASTGTIRGIATTDLIFYAIFGPLNVVIPFDNMLAQLPETLKRVYAFPIIAGAVATALGLSAFWATGGFPELARAVCAAATTFAVYATASWIWRRDEAQELYARVQPYIRKLTARTATGAN